ncbi:DUF6087 family protein [Streptomyces sp. DSM 15324]|uniref:DUF6087 family protein n=1 Tax=Streptomyces sp. DSM 15324 TaxID=1739111 RepID=UPI00099EB3D9|nr:DUF6087 family protein [Streptomyces sp. DSM 15324]
MDIYCRHRPLHGGGGHLRPDAPRGLEEWDGFAYAPAGTADHLAASTGSRACRVRPSGSGTTLVLGDRRHVAHPVLLQPGAPCAVLPVRLVGQEVGEGHARLRVARARRRDRGALSPGLVRPVSSPLGTTLFLRLT